MPENNSNNGNQGGQGAEEFVPSIDDLLSTGTGSDYNPSSNIQGGQGEGNQPSKGQEDGQGQPKPQGQGQGQNGNQGQPQGGEGDDNANNLRSLLSTFGTDIGLSEEDADLRKQLLEKHGGHTFDEQGNIVDENGQIHKSFQDLMDYATSDDELTLDKDGNQIDEEGNVVKTALELARENTVVNEMAYKSGFEFLDENGNPKIYSDDADGFMEFANDVSERNFSEWRQAFFNQHPVLAEVTKHLLTGGSLETFNTPVDYSKIDITKLDDAGKENIIRRSFEVQGFSKDRIDGFIQLFKDSNSVDSQLVKSITDLNQYEQSMAQQRDALYEQQVRQEQQEMEQYWNSVEDKVIDGNLGSIQIPDQDKQGFFDYMSAAVDARGYTQEMLDRGNETLEQQLQIAYLRYKGLDVSTLVKSGVRSQKATSLKQRLKNSAKLKPETGKGTAKKSGLSVDEVTISNLLG